MRANIAAAVNCRQDLIQRIDATIILFEESEIWDFDGNKPADWTIAMAFLPMASAAILYIEHLAVLDLRR